jgi:dienelactone hydrolase
MPPRLFARRSLAAAFAVAIVASATLAVAAGPRVIAEGKTSGDVRLQPPKDLDGYFPFTPPASPEEWTVRAERVRRQILVSQGLWPLPEKTPLNPVIHGAIDKGDYTVEKVYFESLPGFYVTGSLYRPKKADGKVPAVLSPHGHWSNGRFHDAGDDAAKKQVEIKGEADENAAHSPLQARQVQLARMGCVAFHYDMLGYADSQQLSFELVHRFGKQRPEMTAEKDWGFYSPQAEAHLQSVMGLQTWNSIRAIDFLLTLPEVDPERIAVSGASGGGTQTMLLAAVDPRVAVSFPAVMVSTAMQGGCTCENSSCLRVDTGNIEFAALFAPKPQGMTAADDWTKEMATKGFPELKVHYERLGAPENVMLHNRIEFGHNYNLLSRLALYGWLNKHFKLGLSEPIEEQPFERLTTEQMTVWDSEHPKPEGGDAYEKKLAAQLHAADQAQLARLKPTDDKSLAEWRKTAGGALDAILGRTLPAAKDLDFDLDEQTDSETYVQISGLLRNKPRGEELPVAYLVPKAWNGRAIIWLSEKGKAALFNDDGSPAPEVKKLVDSGAALIGVDLLYQGEFLADGQPVTMNRTVKNSREFAGYTYGYNHTLLAQRAHDVQTVVAFVKLVGTAPRSVEVVALDGTGPVAAVALAHCGGAVDRAAIDTHGLRFGKLMDYRDVNFLPGGAKYGDLPGILSLAAPARLWIAGESPESAELTVLAYDAAQGGDKLTFHGGKPEDAGAAALAWLAK